MAHNKTFPRLSVVLNTRVYEAFENVENLTVAKQLQAVNPGSAIWQQDDAHSRFFLLIPAKDGK